MMLAHAGVIAQAGASAPPAPSLPIDWSTDLLFARASAATYWDGTTFTRYASGTARILGDGSLYVEGSRTNQTLASEGYSVATGGTVTADAGTDPAGGATADQFITSAGGGSIRSNSTATYTGDVCASAFVRYVSGDATIQFFFPNTLSLTSPMTWGRFECPATGVSGATSQRVGLREQGAANNAGYLFWGWQMEHGAYFASQHIETSGAAATRLADDAVIEDADVPAAMRSGAWEITIKPRRASTQANDTSTGTLFAFGSGTDNRIHIDSSNRIVVREGGVDEVTTGALTWSADQAITLTFDAAAGTVIVAGATTGNGTTTGTAWTMPSGDVQVGNDAALGTAFFGSISPPVAP